MNFEVKRKLRQDKCCISDYYINGNWFSNILEDKDRDLTSDMSVDEILKIKVPHETAIPTGEYEFVLDWSNRFGCLMPHVLNVKGFDGIRQHIANSDKDVEGCQGIGEYRGGEDFIYNSGDNFVVLMDIMQKATERKEKMLITFTQNYNEPLDHIL